MDVVTLSRLQFAVATYFHFLFVPLTLGLSVLIAIMETIYVRTMDDDYRRMARFWGKIFLINFAVGVVTGITLEFQFGTNWARYSKYVGDIFGSLLAIEATTSFFLESTFIAVWAFGWNRLSPKAHAVTIWLVAGASSLSAVWILIANSWMQHPVGFIMARGRAELADFAAVITQKFAVLTILHTLTAAYILAGFLVMGISAYHILRKQDKELFVKAFRLAVTFSLIFSCFEIFEGHLHGALLHTTQPTKLAAMEAHWDTQTRAPLHLFAIPDPENERNKVEIGNVPLALSLLATHSVDGEVKGLKEFPKDERPPVFLTFFSFRLMAGLAALFVLLTAIGWFKRKKLESSPRYLKIMLYSIPLPYLACTMGWTLTEVGRQPWVVYGLMKTKDAVSPIATSQVFTSLIAFIVVYSLLGLTAFYFMTRYARRGPEPAAATN
ncbi:MAG: cytochrome ubiquinol oxidase subunit I [Deltaproteobacteria bacterium]|nr:cytochrome ubiquinol oxidase subunit I [Deltaproteobacteria bacterium]MBW2070706.1 cytochrome ubiquinol oxidase subunit I [Deltaproteobacteria bacterium]